MLRPDVWQSAGLCRSVRARCCIPVGGAKLRAHKPSASLCDETSSDTSYLSRRMLRLLLSAAPVQGSDGTVRITVLTSATKRQPGPPVIEPGDKPRSKWEPERARAPVSRPELQVVFLSHRSCSSQSANCRYSDSLSNREQEASCVAAFALSIAQHDPSQHQIQELEPQRDAIPETRTETRSNDWQEGFRTCKILLAHDMPATHYLTVDHLQATTHATQGGTNRASHARPQMKL